MNKAAYLIFSLLLCSCSPSMREITVKEFYPEETAPDSSLEAGITLDKVIYKQGEPVYCYVYLKNLSGKNITVNTRMPSDDILSMGKSGIIFTLSPDVNRKTYKTSNPAPPIAYAGYFNMLRPGERFYNSESYDINYIFDSIKPGSYKLKARYINYYKPYMEDKPFDFDASIWLGEVESAEVSFTVEP